MHQKDCQGKAKTKTKLAAGKYRKKKKKTDEKKSYVKRGVKIVRVYFVHVRVH